MSTLASVIIAEVARRLNDTNNTARRWSDATILAQLNLAQKMVARGVPESSMANEFFELSANFEQTLPDDAKGVYTIDYNAGTDGNTRGSSISRIQSAALDEIDLDWRSMTPTAEVQHYYFESDNPTIFGVYPPNDGTQQVHIIYPIIPADCAATNSAISLRDEDVESLTQATIWHTLSDKAENAELREIRNEALAYLKLNVNIQADAEEPAK